MGLVDVDFGFDFVVDKKDKRKEESVQKVTKEASEK